MLYPYLKHNSVGVGDLKFVWNSFNAWWNLHGLAAGRHFITACKLHMGTHNPPVCVPTGRCPFVIAQDEGDMVEDVR